ncbi:bifunctional folylpolyglutamate synthase/dihydrofolate synthase [Tropicimonas sp. S265A]|uniref:bifunctional folylpolyglutamate synthase/dihydrofolate synthase n=1 Tax=Tropicimonas sp. S265A TaxID=3415134 RepID=UPI003C7B59EB
MTCDPARTQGSDRVLARLMALHPKVIDLVLDRVWRLLGALDHPERKLPPVIHVAGTNGKGSTLAMIRAGLEGAGARCHVYTSPHLARFHERIRLAGTLISEDALLDVLEECEAANDGAPITYFEITTVAAFLAFSRMQADYTLLEVGLGGRLDATNVIDQPAVTVITPVSYDHQQFLGNTLPEIAREKAGIIKRGVPCVVTRQDEAALEVIEAQAERCGAPVLAQGQHWHVYEERGRLVYQDERGLLDLPLPALPGTHQMDNAGAALAVLRALDAGNPEAAMTQAVWPARMQKLTQGHLKALLPDAEMWLDGGHNPQAGAALAAYLASHPVPGTHVICGMLRTKDVAGFLNPLAKVSESLTAVSIPGEAATLSAEETRAAAQAAGIKAMTAPSVEAAVRTLAQTGARRVIICGSLYLAGEVLRQNRTLPH